MLTLMFLPWWLAVLCAALTSPLMLRLTVWGFKRRLVILFLIFSVFLIILHALRPEIAKAISSLLKIPHYSMLALLSAGSFSLLFALAGETALWMKFSFRRAKMTLTEKN
jgi:predicted PurR-regulated permease PerM